MPNPQAPKLVTSQGSAPRATSVQGHSLVLLLRLGMETTQVQGQSLLLEDAPLLQTQRDPLSQRWLHSPTWECQGPIVPPSPEVLRED